MKFLALSALIFSLAACSAKVDGIIPQFDTSIGQKVDGPSLEGSWASGCEYTPWGSYRVVELTFAAAAAQRIETIFSDSLCRDKSGEEVFTGSHRYVRELPNDVFEIEYSFYLSSGVTQYVNENITLQGDVLKVSYFSSGDDKVPQMEFKKK